MTTSGLSMTGQAWLCLLAKSLEAINISHRKERRKVASSVFLATSLQNAEDAVTQTLNQGSPYLMPQKFCFQSILLAGLERTA